MKISARILNDANSNETSLRTGNRQHSIDIPAKPNGRGTDVNGGELLFLALAACYCNDLYREASKEGIEIDEIDVTVEGKFGSEGEGARNIIYRARIKSSATQERLRGLLTHTDAVAEIHNTLRTGNNVTLELD
jgi:organic hydroperoxide reductase OsmC/OhrA